MDRQTFVDEVNRSLPPDFPRVTLDDINQWVAGGILPSGDLYHDHVRRTIAIWAMLHEQQLEGQPPKVGMCRYETEEEMAKALGVDLEEAVTAMTKANLHLPLDHADLKEMCPYLGRAARRTRDPFRNAFLHAYLESHRRSIEHLEDTAVIRWQIFGQVKAPFANMEEAKAWIAQEEQRQGSVEDIDYSGKLSAYELFSQGKRTLWSSLLQWQGDDGMDHSCHVAKGGVLDRLRVTSEELAAKIGCPVPRATTHILTGEVPLVPLIEPRPTWRGTNLAGFNIQVNYPWVPVELVKVYYAEFKKIWTGPSSYLKAKRHPSPKAAEVKAFLQTRGGLTWPQKCREWNRLNPDRKYSSWQALQAASRRG